MNNSNTQTILDKIDVIKLDIHLWTGSKKLREDDLKLADGSILPPEELASLGTKKTLDPKSLAEFSRIKKEAERVLLEHGTRFLGGFANPRDKIPHLTAKLDQLVQDFAQAKDKFIANYENETESWILKHPTFASAIRKAIEPAGSVATKLTFDYIVFRLAEPETDQQNSLCKKALGLGGQLFKEITQDAGQLLDKSFVGKDSVTGRVLGGFQRIKAKLGSLSFLDHRCMPIVDEIDRVIEGLPKNGPYTGSEFHSLFSLAMLLADMDRLQRHGQGLSLSASGIQSSSAIDEDDESQTVAEPVDALAMQDTQETLPDLFGDVFPAKEEEFDTMQTTLAGDQIQTSPAMPDSEAEEESDKLDFDDYFKQWQLDNAKSETGAKEMIPDLDFDDYFKQWQLDNVKSETGAKEMIPDEATALMEDLPLTPRQTPKVVIIDSWF